VKGTPGYVVDASVAVKWFSQTGEDDVSKAERLLKGLVEERYFILSPSLILYELCNALRFNPNFKDEDVRKALQSFLKLGIEFADFSEFYDLTIALAFEKRITVYDAAYVALSQKRSLPLVLADYRLLERIRDLPLILPLKDLPG